MSIGSRCCTVSGCRPSPTPRFAYGMGHPIRAARRKPAVLRSRLRTTTSSAEDGGAQHRTTNDKVPRSVHKVPRSVRRGGEQTNVEWLGCPIPFRTTVWRTDGCRLARDVARFPDAVRPPPHASLMGWGTRSEPRGASPRSLRSRPRTTTSSTEDGGAQHRTTNDKVPRSVGRCGGQTDVDWLAMLHGFRMPSVPHPTLRLWDGAPDPSRAAQARGP